MRERKDERRDPDVLRLTRNPPKGEMKDVIHGEEGRLQAAKNMRRSASFSLRGSATRIPGPFWTRQRPDERREPDFTRRRKFNKGYSEAGDVIHRGSISGRTDDGTRRPFGYTCKRRFSSGSQASGPFWLRERKDERREVDVTRRRKFDKGPPEVRDVIHGEGAGGPRRHSIGTYARCRPTASGTNIPGPFWMKQRPDERREPDVLRKRKFDIRSEVPDVIHGEEARARERQERRSERSNNFSSLPPGTSNVEPFWTKERPDERRDPDMDRKKKFGRQRIEAAEIIHGEDFREQWDQTQDMLGAVGSGQVPMSIMEEDEFDDIDDDFMSGSVQVKMCACAPPPPESMTYSWMTDDGSGGRYEIPPGSWMPDDEWGGRYGIPSDVEDSIHEIESAPAARISCAPEAEVSKYDQPNTFMRKLYEKYPYLYQILKETPPEELVSRVFKDRFLSTYQVDYLHLGVGHEHFPKGGPHREEKFTGPDGEPETSTIPGCSYRYSQKGSFGRKTSEYEKKEKDDEEVIEVEKEEPRISEYMATISKLGGEIVTDQLYKVSQLTKNMKHQYKNM